MADLLTRLRRLIGDKAGASQVWTDQELQDAFDVYEVTHRYERLDPLETVLSTRVRIYLDFFAQNAVGDWEASEELVDAGYQVVVPDTANRIQGKWHFNSPLTNWVVRISGSTYDIYGTAADVCRQWAATVKLEFHVKTKERDYSREQQYEMLCDLADRYEAKRLPVSATMVRTDTA